MEKKNFGNNLLTKRDDEMEEKCRRRERETDTTRRKDVLGESRGKKFDKVWEHIWITWVIPSCNWTKDSKGNNTKSKDDSIQNFMKMSKWNECQTYDMKDKVSAGTEEK